ncbi:DNA-processing protein DprA [Nocardioides fonticola]|uniref:DNA-processing protein DprA n=1 Tax=Nocardioides fonticola TaxID=450363 RepID=A0ABP7Y1U4_9ACTN
MSAHGVATDGERLARAALSRLVEPGHLGVARMLAELGAEELHRELSRETALPHLHDELGERLRAIDPRRELEQADRLGIRFVVPGDEEWPTALDDLAAAEPLQQRGGVPLGLWVRGPLRLDAWAGAVAVVGSRSATTYGTAVAGDLVAGLGRQGVGVVSGAAFGIDQAAHRAALGSGTPTAAVLACGVDRVYPEAHRDLLTHLAREQLVVSESPPGAAPMRVRFLARNRIIAALTAGTVVVEAAVRSGALNTANWAARLGRPLLAVPGPVTSAASQGAHQLVRSGAATLVTCADDVLEVLAPVGQRWSEAPRGRDRPRDALSMAQRQVLDAVPLVRAAPTGSIARAAGLGERAVAGHLDRLADQGFVERREEGWVLTPTAVD